MYRVPDEQLLLKEVAQESMDMFPKDPYVKEKWIDSTGRDNWFPTKLSTICSKHFKTNDYTIKKSGYKYLNPGAFPSEKVVSCRSFPCDHLDHLKSVTECNTTQTELADVSKGIKQEQQKETYESILVVDSYGGIKLEKREQDSSISDLDNDSKQMELQSPVSLDPLAIPSSSTQADISSGKILMDKQSNVFSCPSSNESTPEQMKLKQIIATKDYIIERQRKQIKCLQSQNRRLKIKINKIQGVQNALL